MNKYKRILMKLDSFSQFGKELLKDGTVLLGKANYIAPLAYAHSLYGGLSLDQIEQMEESLGMEIPQSLRDFYKFFNGLKLFNSAFSIYGFRINVSRGIDAVRQPYDITTYNVDERIIDADDNVLVIGGYSWDGSKIYMNIKSEKIFYCSGTSIKPLKSWDSLEEMLEKEIKRLLDMHDEEGRNIPLQPTVPVGGEEVLFRMIERAKEKKNKPYWYSETLKHIKS